MPLSRRQNATRMRKVRKAHVEYVRSLEARVVQQDAEIALLQAILAHQEETGYPLPGISDLLARMDAIDAATQENGERMDAAEARQQRLAARCEDAIAQNAALRAELATERQRNTQLEADLARIEMMMDSLLREGDLS